MSEVIPADVMRRAQEVALGFFGDAVPAVEPPILTDDERRLADIIARAILAERERCAKIADSCGDMWSRFDLPGAR